MLGMRRLYGTGTAKGRAVRLLALVLLHAALLLCAGSSADAREGLAEAADRAFRAWMRSAGVRDASLAVMAGDTFLGAFGYGARGAEEPAPLASLSKAITAACVGTLVDAGRLSYATPLGEVLGAVFRERGEPKNGRVKDITVGQLVTHRSA
jgi:CubicO group peptidase (beta-lactamase class C family)